METLEISPLGQSDIGSYLNCMRAFMYRHERGWAPKDSNLNMTIGTIFHAGCAAGYTGGMGTSWLDHAIYAAKTVDTDRDGRHIDLDEEKRNNVCDMLQYYWEHCGSKDQFDRVLAVEEPMYLRIEVAPGIYETIRGTADLIVEQDGEPVIYDHKTSGSIDEDQAHLLLDAQTHVYYLMAYTKWRRPVAFVHNFIKRFGEGDKTVTGPPSFERLNGAHPYEKTLTGKARTASDDPNDYVRRVRTPLSERQLAGYYDELRARLKLLNYSRTANVWPRHDQKLGFGCKSCAFYGPCTTEIRGDTVDPSMLEMLYDVRSH